LVVCGRRSKADTWLVQPVRFSETEAFRGVLVGDVPGALRHVQRARASVVTRMVVWVCVLVVFLVKA